MMIFKQNESEEKSFMNIFHIAVDLTFNNLKWEVTSHMVHKHSNEIVIFYYLSCNKTTNIYDISKNGADRCDLTVWPPILTEER